MKDKYYGYKAVNEASLKKVIEISKDPSLVQEFQRLPIAKHPTESGSIFNPLPTDIDLGYPNSEWHRKIIYESDK